jgi:hypothetical protein
MRARRDAAEKAGPGALRGVETPPGLRHIAGRIGRDAAVSPQGDALGNKARDTMTKIVVSVLVLALLSACGSRNDRERGTVARSASGPIASACLQAGRKSATRQLCGCVQAVANDKLSASDQRLGARFFTDPALAHSVWRSDTASDDAFWERWKAFGDSAARTCKPK